MMSHHDSSADEPTPATDTAHSQNDQVDQDTAYSPGSETETQQKQQNRVANGAPKKEADSDEPNFFANPRRIAQTLAAVVVLTIALYFIVRP